MNEKMENNTLLLKKKKVDINNVQNAQTSVTSVLKISKLIKAPSLMEIFSKKEIFIETDCFRVQ